MASSTGKRHPEYYYNGRMQEPHEKQSKNNPRKHINQINPQEDTPRLGLALKMSTSEIKRLELALSQQNIAHQELRVSQRHHSFKACDIPALSLKVGNWEWESKREGDLVAKFYYRTKKLVWEVLYGYLKKKIEIQWSHISAINIYPSGNNTSRLEIQLKEHPKLCEEMQLNPKMRTKWENTGNDFTGGQTRICNKHVIIFAKRVLDGPFRKLLECDKRLFNLTQQPFPYQSPPLFQHQILDFSHDKSIHEWPPVIPNNIHQGTIVPYGPNLDQPVRSFVGLSRCNLPTQALESPSMDQSTKNRSPDISSPLIGDEQDDFSRNKSTDECSSIIPNKGHQGTIVPPAPNLDQPAPSFVGHSSSNLPTTVLKSPGRNTPIPENSFAVIRDEKDDILPNHEMDLGFLDDLQLPELLEMDMMNDAEPCKLIHQSYEMTPTTEDYEDETFYKENNSCLTVEARIGDNSSNEVKNPLSYADDDIFTVCDRFTL